MFLTAALGAAIAMQVTPDRLERSRMARPGRHETHAGSRHIPGERVPGRIYAYTTMGDRIRQFDVLVTDFGAGAIGWPHRLDGKVYDELDPAGREKLLAKQMSWVDHRDGYPDPAMAGQYNHPGSRYYAEKSRAMKARMRKNGSLPEMRQPK